MSFRSSRSKSAGPSQKRSPGSSKSRSPGPRIATPGSRISSRERGANTVRSRSPKRARKVIKTGTVVIDTGTGTCKAGFAGQQTPQVVLEMVVGYPTEKSMRTRRDRPDTFVGKRAQLETDVDIILPLRNGIIIDWEAVEVLWRHLFNHDLKAAPEEHALLLSDPPLCPTTNREKLVEVVFESLNSPAMYVAYQSVLSVYAHGKISGLVVDTGYAVTHTVPVHQGYNLMVATPKYNSLKYADDTTLMAESEEELKNLVMRVKESAKTV
uniref:Actin-like n=1 Tax=Pogona vitticeps TaxID=103695 RepID=A0ABM5ENY7_9SAUR